MASLHSNPINPILRAALCLCSSAALGVFAAAVTSAPASAQSRDITVEAPVRQELFQDDIRREKLRKKKLRAQSTKVELPPTTDLNIKAPQVSFEKDQNVAHASGGIVVSSGGNRIEAEGGKVNLDSKDADVEGRVVMTAQGVQVTAESGQFNLDTEKGTFNCANLNVDQDAFKGSGGEIKKLSEDSYNLKDASLTSCNCIDESGAVRQGTGCDKGEAQPWSVNANSVHITRNGYAHAYGTTVNLNGIPVMYSPYLGFPVKEKRQSGLLVPRAGYSSKDGLKLEIPFFLVVDESTDFLINPFTATQTRTGTGLDYRQSFSRYNQVTSRFIYSNESARDGSLRGTNVEGIFAPYPDYQYYDDNRLAGYYKQIWRSAPESGVPVSFIVDGNYVSDRLVLREMGDRGLGDYTDRDQISTAVLRTGLGEYGEAELLTEYDQPLDDRDQSFTVQRLPEARVSLQKSLRPFGYNPYGVKVVSQLQYLGDEFYREEGYDGFRSHAVPSLAVPFRVSNMVRGSVQYSYLHTDYMLDDTSVPNIPTEQSQLAGYEELDDRQSRNIGIFQAGLGTAVERVFNLDADSWLATLTALGSQNQANRLARLKHTFEPSVRFMNIPDVDQDGLPVFDTLGRIAEKRVLSYGFRSSLYGRFLPLNRSQEAIPELVPEISDLPTAAGDTTALDEDAMFETLGIGGPVGVRSGEIRELARLVMKQAYDFVEEKEDNNPNRDPFSDIGTNLYLMPTPSFAVGAETNFNQQDGQFDSIALSNHLFDDRGDALRARWTFTQDSDTGTDTLSQIEASIEVKATERIRLGWYTRYDNLNDQPLQNHAAIRLLSTCNCWHLDLDYGQTQNPTREEVMLRFTFSGLGDITAGTQVGNQSNQ